MIGQVNFRLPGKSHTVPSYRYSRV